LEAGLRRVIFKGVAMDVKYLLAKVMFEAEDKWKYSHAGENFDVQSDGEKTKWLFIADAILCQFFVEHDPAPSKIE
jgi:hypothetical protein